MNNVYMLNQKKDKDFNAAGKAMRDVFDVFGRLGMKVIPGVRKDAWKGFKVLDFPMLCAYLLAKAGKNDRVVYSYPENRMKIRLLCRLSKIKGYKTVCFINDLNSIRRGSFEEESVKAQIREELLYVGCADIILAPNVNTVKFLDLWNVKSRMIPVGAWDYLMPEDKTEPYRKHTDGAWRIAFAGNLDKATFLFKLSEAADENVVYELWGNTGKDKSLFPENTEYHAAIAPEKLPAVLVQNNCHFGLVWDGISIDTCDGGLGLYLRYNNSHKCGLYLASGIPVFVWSESGLAHFVKEHGCGYVIDSLSDINRILKEMTDEEYDKIIQNTESTAKIIRKGGLLEAAYKKMLE